MSSIKSMTVRVTLVLACLLTLGLMAAPDATAHDTVIHVGTLIDGTAAEARARSSILVHDERISAVEAGFVSPAGAEVIDLSALDGHARIHRLPRAHLGQACRAHEPDRGLDDPFRPRPGL